MKRKGCLFESIIDFNNIISACLKAFRGKNQTKEVFRYKSNLIEICGEIRDKLIRGDIDFGHYREFLIYEPKERKISAPNLRQRIIQHSIMNICHDYFERKYIYHSYASRPGKGIHAAVNAVYKASRKKRFYLKLDFKKYFDSIDHDILKRKLLRMFKDKRLLDLFFNIIDSYETDKGKGIPIGNLTSQYFANIYLSDLDHQMLEQKGVKCYFRYMDDVVILANDQSYLKETFEYFKRVSSTMLKLNLKQPVYGSLKTGISFLGYKISKEGLSLNGKSKRRFKRKINLINRLYENNQITEHELAERSRALIAFTCHVQSYKFREYCLT